MMNKIIFIFIVLMRISVFSYDLLEYQIEEKVKQKVDSVIYLFDPNAKSVLVVDFYKTKDILPGTSLTGVDSEFFEPQVSNIQLSIYSKEKMDLKFISQQISSVLKIDLQKIKISQSQPLFNQAAEKKIDADFIDQTIDHMSEKIKVLVGLVLAAVLFIGTSLMMIYLKSRKKMSNEFTGKIHEAISQIQISSPSNYSNTPSPAAYTGASVSNSVSLTKEMNNQVIDLPTDGLMAYLSDCYWTKNDSFAYSFWLSLNSKQKVDLLNSWETCKEYSIYFSKVKPVINNSWQHPYYLSPLNIHSLSQDDLYREIKKNNSLWNLISPLRQDQFQLSLKERLEFSQSKRSSQSMVTDKKSSPRKLSSNLSVSELTLEDENYILSNLEKFDLHLMQSLPSLVWLTLLNEADRSEILSGYDARSLSEVLIGPDHIIDLLMNSVTDKKRQLIISYKNKVQLHRRNPVYLSLVEQIVMLIEQKSYQETETHAA